MTLEEYEEIEKLCTEFENKSGLIGNQLLGSFDAEIAINKLQSELTILIKQSFGHIHNGQHLGVLIQEVLDSDGNTNVEIILTNKGEKVITRIPHGLGKTIQLVLLGIAGWEDKYD